MFRLKKIYHRFIEELTLDDGVAPLREIDYVKCYMFKIILFFYF